MPPTVTTVVHTTVPVGWSVTLITAPGSPVPEMIGELEGVVLPLVGAKTTGAAGAVVSIVNFSGAVGLVLPATSLAVTASVWGPLAIGRLGVQDQLPLASAIVVQIGTPLSATVIVDNGSAVPLITGRLLFVLVPLIGPVTVGVTGARLSTVTVTGGEVRGPT